MAEFVTSGRQGAAGIVTIDRPERRNALNLQVKQEIVAQIQALVQDTDVAAIVLTGAGGSFVAGTDIAEMAQMRTTAATPVRQASSSDDDIVKKVEALVAKSEERQRREFTLRSVEMAREFEAQRRIDMATVRETVGQFQGAAGTEIRQQREAIDRINNFIRVSQQAR